MLRIGKYSIVLDGQLLFFLYQDIRVGVKDASGIMWQTKVSLFKEVQHCCPKEVSLCNFFEDATERSKDVGITN